jgi:cytochrome c553
MRTRHYLKREKTPEDFSWTRPDELRRALSWSACMRSTRFALLLITAAAVLTACQRGSAPGAGNTRAMGAAQSPASAPASAPVAKASAPVSAADLGAGHEIARQGAPGTAACASCHGPNGIGNPQAAIPRLAGLGRQYIEHQLNSYADGTRANAVMTPVAGALSAQQRSQVASFYSSLGNPDATPGAAAAASAPQLVTRGDDRRAIAACVTCHGANGTGDASANPPLDGQNEAYLAAALAAWKSGARHNDASGKMPAIAKALTDDEAKALAAYYASQPPPAAPK